jgi:opine dehydrogenase
MLGAGDAGVCLAASIAASGHQVTLWNRTSQRLAALDASDGVLLRRPDLPDTRVDLGLTADLPTACARAEVILLAVSSSAQAAFLAAHWEVLRQAMVVVLVPGHTGGVLAALHALGRSRGDGNAVLAEMPLPFVGRRTGDAYTIHISKTSTPLAVAASKPVADRIVAVLQQVVPTVTASESLLHSLLSNTTAVLQPALAWSNAEAIRDGALTRIYAEGMTPAVVEIASNLDEERLALAASLDADVPSLTGWFTSTYRVPGRNIGEAVSNCHPLHQIPAPRTLNHRFATEHVRTGAVPLAQLARVTGAPHAHFDALTSELSAATCVDLLSSGRSLSDMGLAEAGSATEIRDRIEILTQEGAP